jgi:hypothetical protein
LRPRDSFLLGRAQSPIELTDELCRDQKLNREVKELSRAKSETLGKVGRLRFPPSDIIKDWGAVHGKFEFMNGLSGLQIKIEDVRKREEAIGTDLEKREHSIRTRKEALLARKLVQVGLMGLSCSTPNQYVQLQERAQKRPAAAETAGMTRVDADANIQGQSIQSCKLITESQNMVQAVTQSGADTLQLRKHICGRKVIVDSHWQVIRNPQVKSGDAAQNMQELEDQVTRKVPQAQEAARKAFQIEHANRGIDSEQGVKEQEGELALAMAEAQAAEQQV